MSRRQYRMLLPEHTIKEHFEFRTEVSCDGCGKVLVDDGAGIHNDDDNELIIYLNESECVSPFRQRDYCNICVEPIWIGINQLIKADPDVEAEGDPDAT